MRQFIERITRQAGDAMLKIFRKPGLIARTKANAGDFVTEADELSNKILVSAIKRRFPDHGIISEETGTEKGSAEYVWILDPLDGTRNYLTRVPSWGVMVGLARKGSMIAAAIYDPNQQEFMYAERGKGTFLEGRRCRCASQNELPYSYGCMAALMNKDKIKLFVKIAKSIRQKNVMINNLGSMAITAMYLASGRRDWMITSGSPLWDYAIPSLILSESGCKVANFKGKPWQFGDKEFLAANPRMQPQLLKLLR